MSTFIFNEETRDKFRWQGSPLVHAMNAVIEASKSHTDKDARVGDNNATKMVVHHASELALLRDEIYAGELDGLGYKLDK